MSVMFRIPDYLASFTGQRISITLDGSPQTVGQALELLWSRFPGLHDRLVDEQSRLRPRVNVFIANDPIPQKDGLTTALPDGAPISIFPALGMF